MFISVLFCLSGKSHEIPCFQELPSHFVGNCNFTGIFTKVDSTANYVNEKLKNFGFLPDDYIPNEKVKGQVFT